MNPLTNVKNITKLCEIELAKGTIDKKSWHDLYKDSAWIFIGGLAYGLTEGDIITVFSQYGEIVNINLVRDKKTGKTKGFCFLCYANQKSTVLAVDNLNGIKLCGRTIRVDHVANYKPPKENEQDDELTKMLKSEGCAPKLIKQEPPDNSTEEKHKKKKSKKEKKHKKKKKQSETDSPIHIKVEKQDPSFDSPNIIRTESTEQNQRSAKEMYAKDLKRLEKLQQESRNCIDDMSKSRNKNKHREVSSSRYEKYEFPSSTKSNIHRSSSSERKKSDKSHSKHHTSKTSKSSKERTGKNALILSSEEKSETHKNIQKKKGYHNEPSSSSTDSDSGSRDKYSHKKDTKKHKRHDSSSSAESSQERQFHFKDLRDNQLLEKKRYKARETEKYSTDTHRRYDYNKHYDKEEKSHTNKHQKNSTTNEVNKNGALSCHDKYRSVNKRTSRNDDYDQYNHSVNRKKHCRDYNTERYV